MDAVQAGPSAEAGVPAPGRGISLRLLVITSPFTGPMMAPKEAMNPLLLRLYKRESVSLDTTGSLRQDNRMTTIAQLVALIRALASDRARAMLGVKERMGC